eukprot:Nitzschia sp. Nitz4//scaffold78_size91513//39463//40675//NITZ4_004925-RA/size91513-snap-gene-0.121-mRNA-1//1//CDS//3329558118//9189//frame0
MAIQWSTQFTKQFPCRLPLLMAPMRLIAGPKLAAETCRAGGLGFLAAGHLVSEEAYQSLEKEILEYRSLVAPLKKQDQGQVYPLCIGFLVHSTFGSTLGWELYDRVLQQYKPNVVQFFAGSVRAEVDGKERNAVDIAHSYGCQVVMQVASASLAKEAFDAGADCLMVQGGEAGGHGLRRDLGSGTLSLTAKVVDMAKQRDRPIPILAAGGISDGRDVAAVLALGADGAVLGTRLYASDEAQAPAAFKNAIVQTASGDDVVRTQAFDTLFNAFRDVKWPGLYSSSALRNETTENWDLNMTQLDSTLTSGDTSASVVEAYQKATTEGDPTLACVFCGKGVGKISSIEPAYDILTRIEQETVSAIKQTQTLFSESSYYK